MKHKHNFSKLFFPVFYAVVFALMVLYTWNVHSEFIWSRSDFYQNIREAPAFVKRGFDKTTLTAIPDESGGWRRYQPASLDRRIIASGLPDLPKHTFLSPFGKPAEEFTIVFLFEINNKAMLNRTGESTTLPGLYFPGIGENWEIFLNGTLLRSELHQDTNGRITERRTWHNVYFPADSSHFIPGTNILAVRIVGDPAYVGTGIFYNGTPIYIDDYRVIEKRHNNFLLLLLSGICIYAGAHYILLFFSVKNKKEMYNFCFGIFSILLCIYSIARHSMIYYIFPNSNISLNLEYGSLIFMVPVFGMFIETLIMGRITKITWGYFSFSSILFLTRIFLSSQYTEDTNIIWDIMVLFYFGYIVIHVMYAYYKTQGKRIRLDMHMSSILIGTAAIYLFSIIDIFNNLLGKNPLFLFQYNFYVLHIAMTFALSQRFGGMYKRLEQSNIILLKTIAELVECRDDVTGGHIERTSKGVEILLDTIEENGAYRGETKSFNHNLLLQSCQLHDVGKISINDNILKKPGKLTGDEFEEMKNHTRFGKQILEKVETLVDESEFLEYAKTFAATHHEKWDGSGYPDGKKEHEIPLLGRIMAIADVYDALVSIRPYKKALTHEEAVEIIRDGSGTHFDPELVKIFISIAYKFKETNIIARNDGQVLSGGSR